MRMSGRCCQPLLPEWSRIDRPRSMIRATCRSRPSRGIRPLPYAPRPPPRHSQRRAAFGKAARRPRPASSAATARKHLSFGRRAMPRPGPALSCSRTAIRSGSEGAHIGHGATRTAAWTDFLRMPSRGRSASNLRSREPGAPLANGRAWMPGCPAALAMALGPMADNGLPRNETLRAARCLGRPIRKIWAAVTRDAASKPG